MRLIKLSMVDEDHDMLLKTRKNLELKEEL